MPAKAGSHAFLHPRKASTSFLKKRSKKLLLNWPVRVKPAAALIKKEPLA